MGLQGKLAEIRAAGGTLLAVSSDPIPRAQDIVREEGLGFPVLSDPELKVIRAYGVEHEGKGIALPSTFVVARSGRITFRYVGTRPWDRPMAERIVEELGRSTR